MLKIKQYVKAESLEQAYELNQKKTNRIVGGMLWLKMSTAQIQTAICPDSDWIRLKRRRMHGRLDVWYPFVIWSYTKD